MAARSEDDALALAERVLEVLGHGAITTTYKFAVLAALVDLSLEATGPNAVPAATFELSDIARRVLELYWAHATEYAGFAGGPRVPRQVRAPGQQAELLTEIYQLRRTTESDGGPATIARARMLHSAAFGRVMAEIEWKLAEQPLPRLQKLGSWPVPFLYEIAWDERITRAGLNSADMDRRIHLLPGVAENLARLSGLLRPAILQRWLEAVNRMNGLEIQSLDRFLFDHERLPTAPVEPALRELDRNSCFYCRRPVRGIAHVDHFVPWSRYPDNGLANLVLAHVSCNEQKSAYMAATVHVERWRERMVSQQTKLDRAARELSWDNDPERTLGVARGIYLRMPGEARLWVADTSFTTAATELPRLRIALAT